MAIVEVTQVSKTFRIPRVERRTLREHALDLFRTHPFQELRVLNRISFDVQPGETLGIMGRNGSGKSTLLRIIAGIYQPDEGSVRVKGALTAIMELGIGWNPELDAIDNILLVGSVMGLTLRDLRRATEEILAFAELERFARLKLQHYSSGMASRLAYAIAFKAVREILVLDEIFAVGDAGFQARCEERYRQLRSSGHTVIVVSHDPRTVMTFCDRVLLIDDAQIVAEGSAPEIVREYLSTIGGNTLNTSEPVDVP